MMPAPVGHGVGIRCSWSAGVADSAGAKAMPAYSQHLVSHASEAGVVSVQDLGSCCLDYSRTGT